jgi:hypothetical protein
MTEVWDIHEHEVEPASLHPLGGGWRLKVQSSRDEQREREALGIGPARHQDAATTDASPSAPARRV